MGLEAIVLGRLASTGLAAATSIAEQIAKSTAVQFCV